MGKKRLVVLALVLAGAGMTWAGPGTGELRSLTGVYSFSGVRSCVQTVPLTTTTPDGFTPSPALSLLLPGSTRSAHLSGTLTLFGDGTGMLLYEMLQVFNQNINIGQKPVNTASGECEVTYGANPDGTYWLDTENCFAEVEEGAGAGTVATVVSGPTPLILAATPNGQFLQMANAQATVERSEQWPVADPTAVSTFDRICGRNYTAVLISRNVRQARQ